MTGLSETGETRSGTWFQAQGSESKGRMIAALRIYAEAHKDVAPRSELVAA